MADAAKAKIENLHKLKFYRKKNNWKLAPEKEAEEKKMVMPNDETEGQTDEDKKEEEMNVTMEMLETLHSCSLHFDDMQVMQEAWCAPCGVNIDAWWQPAPAPAPFPRPPPPPPPARPHSYTTRLPAPLVYTLRNKPHPQYIDVVEDYEEFERGAALTRHSSEYNLVRY